MLTKESTLRDIEEANQTGKMNTKQIANALNVGENKLRRVLKAVGFIYDTQTKQWRYDHTGEEADQLFDRPFWSLTEYNVGEPIERGASRNKESEGASASMANVLTEAEIKVLKELAARHTAALERENVPLYEALKNVPKGKAVQKTFVIDPGVIEALDTFCDKHRVKKSDFLTMAIQDALLKFDN